MAIRKGLADIRRTLRSLEKFEESYCAKARRAEELEAQQEYQFLVAAVRRTSDQKRLLERQLLSLETALQLKEQSECHARFCGSMAALAKSVGQSFQEADLTKTQASFVQAMHQAQEIEERMSLFLEESELLLTGTYESLDQPETNPENRAYGIDKDFHGSPENIH
jgi:hypothetical protein